MIAAGYRSRTLNAGKQLDLAVPPAQMPVRADTPRPGPACSSHPVEGGEKSFSCDVEMSRRHPSAWPWDRARCAYYLRAIILLLPHVRSRYCYATFKGLHLLRARTACHTPAVGALTQRTDPTRLAYNSATLSALLSLHRTLSRMIAVLVGPLHPSVGPETLLVTSCHSEMRRRCWRTHCARSRLTLPLDAKRCCSAFKSIRLAALL